VNVLPQLSSALAVSPLRLEQADTTIARCRRTYVRIAAEDLEAMTRPKSDEL
jgi:hypothetical protein